MRCFSSVPFAFGTLHALGHILVLALRDVQDAEVADNRSQLAELLAGEARPPVPVHGDLDEVALVVFPVGGFPHFDVEIYVAALVGRAEEDAGIVFDRNDNRCLPVGFLHCMRSLEEAQVDISDQ